MNRPQALARLLPLVALLTACDDIDSPAELDHPQLLAIATNPASVPPGGNAALSVLVAGADGTLAPTSTTWTVRNGPGAIDGGDSGGSGTTYRAPSSAVADHAVIAVRVELPDGHVLTGEKRVGIGDAAVPPPTVVGLLVSDTRGEARDGFANDPLVLPADEVFDLALAIDPAPSNSSATLTTWHATCGTFERFREPVGVFHSGPQPCAGVLYGVYRDERGGTTWLERRVAIETGAR